MPLAVKFCQVNINIISWVEHKYDMDFKQFFEAKVTEEDKNIRETLRRLPASHRKLLRGFHYEFETGNTLDHDDNHVGQLDNKKKVITVAAPWVWSREWTFLHEVGHKVYVEILNNKQRKEWEQLSRKHKRESSEEAFCMVYSQFYAKNKLTKFDHSDQLAFVRKLT